MTEITPQIQELINKYFPPETHPYRVFESTILDRLGPSDTVLDIGCGRTAPVLRKLKGKAGKLVGIDLVDFVVEDEDLSLIQNSVSEISGVGDNAVNLAYSRSVMEHIGEIDAAYEEVARVLKPGGVYVFLTPNFWDYGSLMAWIIPNGLHPLLVRISEGRAEADTFPVHYKSNTIGSIARLAQKHGFEVQRIEYLGQYPNYFIFNRFLFWAGCKYEKFLERHPRLHWLRGWILCVLSKPQPGAAQNAETRE